MDIEDDAGLVGDLDVETFPTLLIARDRTVLFLGQCCRRPRCWPGCSPACGRAPRRGSIDVQAQAVLERVLQVRGSLKTRGPVLKSAYQLCRFWVEGVMPSLDYGTLAPPADAAPVMRGLTTIPVHVFHPFCRPRHARGDVQVICQHPGVVRGHCSGPDRPLHGTARERCGGGEPGHQGLHGAANKTGIKGQKITLFEADDRYSGDGPWSNSPWRWKRNPSPSCRPSARRPSSACWTTSCSTRLRW